MYRANKPTGRVHLLDQLVATQKMLGKCQESALVILMRDKILSQMLKTRRESRAEGNRKLNNAAINNRILVHRHTTSMASIQS